MHLLFEFKEGIKTKGGKKVNNCVPLKKKKK